jgi:hypothetical protein
VIYFFYHLLTYPTIIASPPPRLSGLRRTREERRRKSSEDDPEIGSSGATPHQDHTRASISLQTKGTPRILLASSDVSGTKCAIASPSFLLLLPLLPKGNCCCFDEASDSCSSSLRSPASRTQALPACHDEDKHHHHPRHDAAVVAMPASLGGVPAAAPCHAGADGTRLLLRPPNIIINMPCSSSSSSGNTTLVVNSQLLVLLPLACMLRHQHGSPHLHQNLRYCGCWRQRRRRRRPPRRERRPRALPHH